MKVSKLEEQGLRLALALAKNHGQMTLPELSQKEQFSEALVAKIMGKLRRGGLVRASRGRHGGYELIDSPESTTVAAVLRSLGRPVFEGCFSARPASVLDDCPHMADCSLRPVWEYLSAEVSRTLEEITLAELMQKERDIKKMFKPH